MKNPKAKGTRIEREIKRIFEKHGFKVIRSAGSLGLADLLVYHPRFTLSLQVKGRKTFSCYSMFSSDLKEPDALILKANYRTPLIVLPLGKFLEIVKKLEDFQK